MSFKQRYFLRRLGFSMNFLETPGRGRPSIFVWKIRTTQFLKTSGCSKMRMKSIGRPKFYRKVNFLKWEQFRKAAATNLLKMSFLIFGFHTNRTKMTTPWRQFKTSAACRKGESIIAHDAMSILHGTFFEIDRKKWNWKGVKSVGQLTPMMTNNRRYKKNLKRLCQSMSLSRSRIVSWTVFSPN